MPRNLVAMFNRIGLGESGGIQAQLTRPFLAIMSAAILNPLQTSHWQRSARNHRRTSPSKAMGLQRHIASTLLLCTGLLACGVPPMPDVSVSGDASHVLRFDEWKQIVGVGRVVKWSTRVTRQSDEPIGSMAYALYDADGVELLTKGLDYRTSYQFVAPFRTGDSLRLGIPAYRESTSAHTVTKIVITVRLPVDLSPAG